MGKPAATTRICFFLHAAIGSGKAIYAYGELLKDSNFNRTYKSFLYFYRTPAAVIFKHFCLNYINFLY